MDRLERRVARSFAQAASVYAEHTPVQAQARTRLCQRIDEHLHGPMQPWLDLGCGDAALARQLQPGWGPGLLLDIAMPMLQQARLQQDWPALQASLHALPCRPGSLRAVFSNFALQWAAQPQHLMAELARALQVGGWLAFALPVAGSLTELSAAWSQAGRPPPLRPLASSEQWLQAVRSARLRLLHQEEAILSSPHDDARAALHALKHAGVGVYARPPGLLGRQAYARILEALTAPDGHFTLSYRVLWLLARKEQA